MVTNNVSEGSCVTQGKTVSYKKKLKPLYIRTTECPLDIKLSTIDIYLTNIAQKPKTKIFSLFHE